MKWFYTIFYIDIINRFIQDQIDINIQVSDNFLLFLVDTSDPNSKNNYIYK